jgi:hypothetical protein
MVKDNLDWFKGLHYKPGSILDVGSFDVNGACRTVIPVTLGTDMRDGRGVDKVVDACQLEAVFGPESFDNVVSANTLEHCKDWKGTIRNMFAVCKKGGTIAVCTCSKLKGRHNHPNDYWRFTVKDLERAFAGNTVLSKFSADGGKWVGIAVQKTADFEPIDFDVDAVA